MKNKTKIILNLLVCALIVSLGYNLYAQNKVNKINMELSESVRINMQKFAGHVGTIDDECVYREQYTNLVTAQASYAILINNKAITEDEYEYNLSSLLSRIKFIFINDKEKFNEIFEDINNYRLMYHISENLEDKESIHELYKLIED